LMGLSSYREANLSHLKGERWFECENWCEMINNWFTHHTLFLLPSFGKSTQKKDCNQCSFTVWCDDIICWERSVTITEI
jgi:hypothetical protein